jgi:hypothetical protein
MTPCSSFIPFLLLFSALEVAFGAMLYKYQYTKTAASRAFDINMNYPVDEFVLKTGWYLECAASGLFIMASLIVIAESIHSPPPKTGRFITVARVIPTVEKTKVNDKEGKGESP